jgi:hypothetical protein
MHLNLPQFLDNLNLRGPIDGRNSNMQEPQLTLRNHEMFEEAIQAISP